MTLHPISIAKIITALAIAVGGIYAVINLTYPQSSIEKRLPSAAAQTAHRVVGEVVASPQMAAVQLSENDKSALAELRKEWSAIQTPPGIITDQHMDLARRSVARLSCGPALVELLRFLQNKGIIGVEPLFEKEILALFVSGKSAEACAQLSSLSPASDTTRKYREKWSLLAGQGLDENARLKLMKLLDDPACAVNISLGACIPRMPSDPAGAFADALAQLKTGIRTLEGSNFLTVLSREIPAGVDFAQIERITEPSQFKFDGNIPSSLRTARDNLFRKWADEDPAGAANYILDNSDRVEPTLMSAVVSAVMQKDASAGFDWLQNLPPGPFLDEAIVSAIAKVGDTQIGWKPARELAGLITNLALREDQLRMLDKLLDPQR